MTFQDIVLKLHDFWKSKGALLLNPYNSEVGAGTFNPATFLKALGSEPWKAAYVEITRRPKDGRYAENPNRLQQYHQYQVILKPAPDDVIELYIDSLEAIGIRVSEHDLRFVEDDWESPTLGAWGLGWEVWLDGLEVTQFTYFQQVGAIDVDLVSAEITYGLERLAMFVQGVESVFDIKWNDELTWGDIYRDFEKQFCVYNFEEADVEEHRRLFEFYEKEAARLAAKALLYPAYDMVIKMSHVLNILDARRAISPEERQNYILRVRRMAKRCAELVVG